MSVTFYIENDTDKSIVNRYDCQCVDWDTNKPSPNCIDCKGKGEVIFKNSKWSLNLAEGNARTIISGLGLPGDNHGQVYGATLRTAIRVCIPALAHRAEVEGSNHWTMGLDAEYVARVHTRLLEIAKEAEKREEPVIWC